MASVKRQQHNLKMLRHFEEDLWAILATTNKRSKTLVYFYELYKNTFKYRVLLRKRNFHIKRKRTVFLYKTLEKEKEFKRKRKTLKKTSYLNKLKLRRFYGNIGEKQFKKIFKSASISSNLLSKSFAYLIESRLDVILYRANFFKSIFTARQYINHRKIYVNGVIVDRPGYKLSPNDIVTLQNPGFFYKTMKKKLIKNHVLVNYPSYIEVNYKLGSIILLDLPLNSDVPYPFFININYMVFDYLK